MGDVFSADYAVFHVDALQWRNLALRARLRGWPYACALLRPIHRGVALGDLVYVAQLDAKLVALNQADGRSWEQKIDEWKNGVTTNSRR
jgi:hypothetical protein